MTNPELLKEIQERFIGKIMEKNSWGKNEVIEVWKDCLLAALMDRIQ